MKYNIKCIGLLWLFFSACLSACVDDTLDAVAGKMGKSEQVVLRLNVQHESVVSTRAVNVPDETEKIESIDFLIFNDANQVVVHQQPEVTWTGSEYTMTVDIPVANGEHILYLIANYPMDKGTVTTWEDLEKQVCMSADAFVSPPFVMATQKITLSSLSAATINNALSSNVDGMFYLKRNVAKFSVEVTATNFKLNYIEWKNCPTAAPILLEGSNVSPGKKSVSISPAELSSPVYLYQIQNMGADAHQGFHVLVGGEYTAQDGTVTTGYYKLRLCTYDSSGTKTPLVSIDGNSYYKLDIRRVSGGGASSPQIAEMNGFANDMEAFTILNVTNTSVAYRETYLQNGYQLGFTNSHWKIYTSETLNSYTIGHFYRTIRDASLRDNTTFDPDYPDKARGVVTAREAGTEITGMKKCFDTPDVPVEMDLCFTDSPGKAGSAYTFTNVIQYGVLQNKVVIERYPSIDNTYTVLAMAQTNSGEVVTSSSWIGLAAQRHEGATIYTQLISDTNYIFIHILPNDTGWPREATVQLFGRNGYCEIFIRQNG
ncbi:fimbrial protein [Bacteroides congonensis]